MANPIKDFRLTASLRKKFDKYVVKNPRGCWSWVGGKTDGYGVLWEQQTSSQARKQLRSNRVAWKIYRGSIPRGMKVLHKCDNRECTRPSHLFLGTSCDNNRDTVVKGRHKTSNGEDNGKAKLTDVAVFEMKELRKSGLGYSKIAEKFNVTTMTCWRAINGKSWRHVV